MALRRELHRRGLRYRVQYSIVDRRRRHDIVFTRARVVVEVRGCFWHACPTHGTFPKANAQWWADKLQGNRERDQRTDDLLRQAGWTVVIVWEHENAEGAAERVATAIEDIRG